MGMRYTNGFTIIETMLVLAITAALVAGVFIGVGTGIDAQRYRDSAESFKNLLQEQYSQLSNVRNDRSNDWSCDTAAQTVTGGAEARGQSACVLVGRLVTVQSDTYRVYTVLGRESTTPADLTDDLEVIKQNYVLNVSTVAVEENTLEWGAEIAWPESGTGSGPPVTPRDLSLLFLRSPDSGQIYTFVNNTIPSIINPTELENMIVAANAVPGQGSTTICVKPQGIMISDGYSVFIDSYAAVPNAIEMRTNDIMAAEGMTTRC